YWTKLPRWAKALRNNAIVFGAFAFINGMIWAPEATMTGLTLAFVLGVAVLIVRLILKIRRWAARRPVREVKQPMLAKTKVALGVATAPPSPLHVAGGIILDEKPSLSGGVPHKVMCLLLSGPMGVSTDEANTLLTMTPEKGTLKLPD